MEVAVVVEVEAVEHGERGFGSFEFCDGDRAVHGHDRRAGDLFEPLVEERDLFPVAWVVEVEIGDCCLDRVGAAPMEREGAGEEVAAFLDLARVPEGLILVVEQDELAVGRKRAARRAWLISISASRACASASSGISSTRSGRGGSPRRAGRRGRRPSLR